MRGGLRMDLNYTSEKNVQMLIALMKAHNIKKIIASPGNTNVTFVGSVQQDSFFEVYSCVDERSAAYMACGLAAESNEPVAISCTGATASRNYIPALTEAYYRKLPVLAITSTQQIGRIGQLVPQVIDRSVIQKDIALLSVHIPLIHTEEDAWSCNVKLNNALLELSHNGGGPVHINLETDYNKDFSVRVLPEYRVIHRICDYDNIPAIKGSRVGIFCGSHRIWDKKLTEQVDKFCENYNGVVFCDHTSNYHGKYRIDFALLNAQGEYTCSIRNMDLLIDIGEMSGAYFYFNPENVWRVNIDGELKDTWKKLKNIFQMREIDFFRKCNEQNKDDKCNIEYFNECKQKDEYLRNRFEQLPFSNIWMAKQLSTKIPDNSVMHFAILNSLRSWNFFKLSPSIDCYSNTGGFGIDGIMSTIVGAALVNDKLHYCITGDLAFFYDMNSIANKNVKNNLRILLINNGCGIEFKNYNHFAALFKDDADDYIAAKGHNGKRSHQLVKNYVTDLGFEYLSADNKDEFIHNMQRFVTTDITDRPILFEVFTSDVEESNALKQVNEMIADKQTITKLAKSMAKDVIGEKNVNKIKKIIRG